MKWDVVRWHRVFGVLTVVFLLGGAVAAVAGIVLCLVTVTSFAAVVALASVSYALMIVAVCMIAVGIAALKMWSLTRDGDDD